jgi:hypothetical protein
MSYSFSDANKRTWHGPCINGWQQVINLLAKEQPRPALQQLIDHGHTNMLPALSFECTNLATKTNDKDIQHTLFHLAAVAKQADEVVILEA